MSFVCMIGEMYEEAQEMIVTKGLIVLCRVLKGMRYGNDGRKILLVRLTRQIYSQ